MQLFTDIWPEGGWPIHCSQMCMFATTKQCGVDAEAKFCQKNDHHPLHQCGFVSSMRGRFDSSHMNDTLCVVIRVQGLNDSELNLDHSSSNVVEILFTADNACILFSYPSPWFISRSIVYITFVYYQNVIFIWRTNAYINTLQKVNLSTWFGVWCLMLW